VKNPSVAFVKEFPGKLLHRLMVSESTPVSLEVVQETQVNDDVSASSSEKPQVNHGEAEQKNFGKRPWIFNPYLSDISNDGSVPSQDSSYS